MIRFAPLPLLVLLAACGGPPPNSPEAACQEEARNAPGVRGAYERMNPVLLGQQQRVQQEARAAENNAYLRCMRARGLAAPGGVQTVRPPQ